MPHFFAANLHPHLSTLLLSPHPQTVFPALRLIGLITAGSHEQTKAVVDQDVVPPLVQLLGNKSAKVKVEACRALANMVSGTRENVGKLLEAKAVPKALELLRTEDGKLKKELLWIIFNTITKAEASDILDLFHYELVERLCEALNDEDAKNVMIALLALNNILPKCQDVADRIEQCGGLDKIAELQYSPSSLVYKLAFHTIDNFFNHQSAEEMLGELESNIAFEDVSIFSFHR